MCIRLRLILVEAATPGGRERGSINDITNTTTEIIQNTRKGRDRNFLRTAKSIVAPIAGTILNKIIITAGRDINGPLGPPIGIMYGIANTLLVTQK
jgi:hypothetical protein